VTFHRSILFAIIGVNKCSHCLIEAVSDAEEFRKEIDHVGEVMGQVDLED